MAEFETTIKDLLALVRTLLVANTGSGTTLSGIKQVKRGVLPPKPIYDLITIVPVEEQYVSYRASRRAIVAREIGVHVLIKDLRGKKGIYTAEQYIDAVFEILRTNYSLPDGGGEAKTRRVTFGEIDFSSDETNQGVVHDALLPVTYESHETLPYPTLTSAQVDNPSGNSLTKAVFDTLKALQVTTLSSFKEFSRGNFGPRGLFPLLVVDVADESQGNLWDGVDDVNTGITVSLYSKIQGAADSTLTNHLNLLEPVKDGLQTDIHWGGRCSRSEISGINFTTALKNNEQLYETNLTLSTRGKDNSP